MRSQELESDLIRTVGFPHVVLPSGIVADTPEAIDQALGRDAPEDVRAALHAALAAHQTQWDEAAAAVDLAGIKRQEIEAHERRDELAGRIFNMRAKTLAGVRAKTEILGELSAIGSPDLDFPSRQIRSIQRDLARLTA